MNGESHVSNDAYMPDVLIIGTGLGASAAACQIAHGGHRVTLIPGAGRSRSRHIDGGIVTRDVLVRAFGEDPPISPLVNRSIEWQFSEGRSAPRTQERPIGVHFGYQRDLLEEWALATAVDRGAVVIPDFVEGQLKPADGDGYILSSERDNRAFAARVVILAEGYDPRVGMRERIRPDYSPEEQLHTARQWLSVDDVPREYQFGAWRTDWGMPVRFQLIPGPTGVLVTVTARIENVMRGSRSAREALDDFIANASSVLPVLRGVPSAQGVELMYQRIRGRPTTFAKGNLLVAVDAAGLLDPRSFKRADFTIATGQELGGFVASELNNLSSWEEIGDAAASVLHRQIEPFHDDPQTGYIEEGRGSISTSLGRVLGRLGGRNRT